MRHLRMLGVVSGFSEKSIFQFTCKLDDQIAASWGETYTIKLISHHMNMVSHLISNITTYFTVLVAEILLHYFPRYVEIHNYVSANSVNQKLNNWGTLNR